VRRYEGARKKWSQKEAKKHLAERETEVNRNEYRGNEFDEVKFDKLASLLIKDYEVNEKKSLEHTRLRLERLRKYFGGHKVIHIPEMVPQFIIDSRAKGWTNAYINRFISMLHRMYTLGYDNQPRLVAEIPRIKKLEENNVRKGFIDHEFYLKFKPLLPDYLQLALMISYSSTLRRGEVFTLRISQFNKISGYVLLEETKNGEQRGFFLRGQNYMDVLQWVETTERKFPECKYIVNNQGNQVKDFRASWETALKRLGVNVRYKCKGCGNHEHLPTGLTVADLRCSKCEGTIFRKDSEKVFHDIRRSSAKNMKNAQVPEEDIKQIGGWKTGSMFTRYNITGEEEQKNAADKTAEYLRRKEEEILRHTKK
jgi:integrase